MTQLPSAIQQGVLSYLKQKLNATVTIHNFSPCGGGCINHGGRLSTSAGEFFLKWNDARKFPDMFAAEARGLTTLASAEAIRIPSVTGHGEADHYQFLLLEFIESTSKSTDYWNTLGVELATLHRQTHTQFGLDHANYIGSLPQYNQEASSWTAFFIEERLQPQIKMGVDTHAIPHATVKKFDTLHNELPSLLVDEPPALVHGDLWSGNLITDDKGLPCLIDPAVYYGNRETDLAMTRLFGGFHEDFYNAYKEAFPVAPGYAQRLEIYTLYPLLVHVNLFGQSYLHQVNSILSMFV